MDDSILGLDLSGLTLRLEGLPTAVDQRLRREWSAFVAPASSYPFLDVAVSTVAGEYDEPEYRPKAMTSTLDAAGATFRMAEGEARVGDGGTASLELLDGIGDRQYFTLVNLLRACLAWSLPSRSGALLHAAGLLIDDSAFLLVGPEGSGKSTWTRLGEQDGAQAISDDLVLVDGIGPRLEVLGAPFGSTHRVRFRRGRWPLAALLFPLHGGGPELIPVTALAAQARLTANLPFIADAPRDDRRVTSLVSRLASAVPCREFRFNPDTTFVQWLGDWRRGGG